MRVQTLDVAKTDIRDTDFQALRTSFRGRLPLPSDPQFDEARRVWNGTIDRRPALIAQCSGAADVIAAVKFAAHHGLLVAVRGGGHSIPGHSVCDDGLVIDLSAMRGVVVDPRRGHFAHRAAPSGVTSITSRRRSDSRRRAAWYRRRDRRAYAWRRESVVAVRKSRQRGRQPHLCGRRDGHR